MADAIVNLIVNAKNQTASVFNQIKSQFNTFQSSLSKTNVFSKLTSVNFSQLKATFSSFTQNGIQGLKNFKNQFSNFSQPGVSSLSLLNTSLLTILGTVGIVTIAFQKLRTSLAASMKREVDNIASVNTAISVLEISEKEASKYVERFNKSVAQMGQALPTSAENINIISRTIFDDYAQALKKAGSSTELIEKTLLSSSSRLALAAEQSGTHISDAQSAIQAFLAGGLGKRGLDQYQFFASNTLLRNSLISGAGNKNFTDMSALERVKLLSDTLEKTITDDTIKRLQGTTKAKISAFTDSLFDPEIGIFSLSRDLEPKIPGYQNVFSSFATTIDLIIGENGLFAQLGRISGIQSDTPLRNFKKAIDGLNEFLKSFVDSFKNIKVGNSSAVASNIGKFLAQLTNKIFDSLLLGLASINYGELFKTIAAGIFSFFANLNWKVYAAGALALISSFLAPFVLGGLLVIGKAILAGILAAVGGIPAIIVGAIILGIIALAKFIFDSRHKAIEGWNYILSTIKSWFNNFISFGIKQLDMVKNFFVGIMHFIFGKEGTQLIFNYYKSQFNLIFQIVKVSFNILKGTISILFNFIQFILNGLINGFKTTWKVLETSIKGLISVVESLINLVVKPIGDFVNKVKTTLPQTIQKVQNSGGILGNVGSTISKNPNLLIGGIPGLIGNFIGEKILGSRFQGGQYPNLIEASKGFFKPINNEIKNKPPGSDLVIANSSEAILTPSQFKNLISGSIAPSQNQKNVNITFQSGSIGLNINGNNSPENIAQQVLNILETTLKQELESQLT